MDTNRDDVKHCSSTLPVFLSARLGVPLGSFLAVSAMAGEVRIAPVNDSAGATLHVRKCPRRARQTTTAL